MLRILLPLLAWPAFAFAQGPFPQPKTFPPDAATLAKIKAKTEELGKAVLALKGSPQVRVDPQVAVFHKAAEWMVRHNEWYNARTAQQTLELLEVGLKRAAAAKEEKRPWLDVRGKPVALGYVSEVDESVQPYSLLFPANFDPNKQYRLDVVLHGRNATLTEVAFLHGKEFAKAGNAPDHFVLEVYGRGNNAYRWAGEQDVFEAISAARLLTGRLKRQNSWKSPIDANRVFLRGFSMGGAGTWHIGLRNPAMFAAISPGAGFTTTHGYIGKLPKVLPDYQEKCLRIYDAVNYAENVFNVPAIAYSGEKDTQKLAADNIENALKNFMEPHVFKHLVAPGLEHKQPPEWLKKIDDEFRKLDGKKPERPERIRFVTYTLNHGWQSWLILSDLERYYDRSVVDARWAADGVTVTTENVRGLALSNGGAGATAPKSLQIDGQKVTVASEAWDKFLFTSFVKRSGKWELFDAAVHGAGLRKSGAQSGPIDDGVTHSFVVVEASGASWHPGTASFTRARQSQFVGLWDKWFRGSMKPVPSDKPLPKEEVAKTELLFGDPQSNPAIAKVLPKLPIKWTKDELVVNGVTYDPATHVPVLIYPHPEARRQYVVLNSGHTFGEADLRGTNALLYPRLGDWAVLKPKPTKADPAAFEVVAAGLFDENWQFPKK